MTTFEYAVIIWGEREDDAGLEAGLNQAGAESWEIAVVLKRQAG